MLFVLVLLCETICNPQRIKVLREAGGEDYSTLAIEVGGIVEIGGVGAQGHINVI